MSIGAHRAIHEFNNLSTWKKHLIDEPRLIVENQGYVEGVDSFEFCDPENVENPLQIREGQKPVEAYKHPLPRYNFIHALERDDKHCPLKGITSNDFPNFLDLPQPTGELNMKFKNILTFKDKIVKDIQSSRPWSDATSVELGARGLYLNKLV